MLLISQMFHAAEVTAAKTAGLFVSRPDNLAPLLSNDGQWCQWAAEQERVRLAWMMFVEDTFGSGVLRCDVLTSDGVVMANSCRHTVMVSLGFRQHEGR